MKYEYEYSVPALESVALQPDSARREAQRLRSTFVVTATDSMGRRAQLEVDEARGAYAVSALDDRGWRFHQALLRGASDGRLFLWMERYGRDPDDPLAEEHPFVESYETREDDALVHRIEEFPGHVSEYVARHVSVDGYYFPVPAFGEWDDLIDLVLDQRQSPSD